MFQKKNSLFLSGASYQSMVRLCSTVSAAFDCVCGILPFSVVFFRVRRCSSVFGGVHLCSSVFLCVRLCTVFGCVRWWSSVLLCSAVSSSFRCIQPGLFTSLLSPSIVRGNWRGGVNDSWYNMRRRIGTFISCVHIFRVHLPCMRHFFQ